jgi:hypothetical protein
MPCRRRDLVQFGDPESGIDLLGFSHDIVLTGDW